MISIIIKKKTSEFANLTLKYKISLGGSYPVDNDCFENMSDLSKVFYEQQIF